MTNVEMDQVAERHLGLLVIQLRRDGANSALVEALRTSTVCYVEDGYDNWNGGTYTYRVDLTVPVLSLDVVQSAREQLNEWFSDKIDADLGGWFGGTNIEVPYDSNWRAPHREVSPALPPSKVGVVVPGGSAVPADVLGTLSQQLPSTEFQIAQRRWIISKTGVLGLAEAMKELVRESPFEACVIACGGNDINQLNSIRNSLEVRRALAALAGVSELTIVAFGHANHRYGPDDPVLEMGAPIAAANALVEHLVAWPTRRLGMIRECRTAVEKLDLEAEWPESVENLLAALRQNLSDGADEHHERLRSWETS